MNYRNENQAQSLGHHPTFTWQQLQTAVLAEREACAKVCEGIGWGNNPYVNPKAGTTCAAAIRVRNEK